VGYFVGILRAPKSADEIAIATARRSVPTDGDEMSTPIPASIPTLLPGDQDALLTRDATAAALTAAGYPIATKTLGGKATRGGGPPYGLFAGRALYRWGDALGWARGRLTPPWRSTSESDAQQGAA